MTRAFIIAATLVAGASLAYASPPGLGSGHPTGTRQASVGGFHFGRDVPGWGPHFKKLKPATIGDPIDGQFVMSCPCDAVRDPFKRRVVGGVPENLESNTTILPPGLRQAVTNQRGTDANGPPAPGPQVDLEDAVRGAHFDPNAPAFERASNGDSAR
jgi:hypothetical protein